MKAYLQHQTNFIQKSQLRHRRYQKGVVEVATWLGELQHCQAGWLQSGFETVLLYKCELSLTYCTMNIDWIHGWLKCHCPMR